MNEFLSFVFRKMIFVPLYTYNSRTTCGSLSDLHGIKKTDPFMLFIITDDYLQSTRQEYKTEPVLSDHIWKVVCLGERVTFSWLDSPSSLLPSTGTPFCEHLYHSEHDKKAKCCLTPVCIHSTDWCSKLNDAGAGPWPTSAQHRSDAPLKQTLPSSEFWCNTISVNR